MYRLILILVVCLLIAPLTGAQSDDSDCDPSEYLEIRQADIAALGELFENATEDDFDDIYLELISYRIKYEDMTDVPECAEELHRLTLAQLTANQDVVGLTLFSILASGEDNPYTELINQTQERLVSLREAALAEVDRLSRLTSSEPITDEDAGEVSTAAGTRSDPIPLGQYYQSEKGKVRITEVIFPYEPETTYETLQDGQEYMAIGVEYICEIENPDESCSTFDAFPADVVLSDGTILEFSDLVAMVLDEPQYTSQEGFGGTTLSGYIYFKLPADADYHSTRMFVDFEQLHFALK